MKNVIISADDYGMNARIDDAIIELAEKGIVTATSVMVLSPSLATSAERIRGLPLNRGLHLDFTSDFACRSGNGLPLNRLILRCSTGTVDPQFIKSAITQQLDGFEDAFQQIPTFVDGHQHVHQLPVISTELLKQLAERYGARARDIGIRSCMARHWRGPKAYVISKLRAPGLEAHVADRNHIMNSDFAGVYDFSPRSNFPGLWNKWLSNLEGDRPLIMCHPGKADCDANDPINAARAAEFNFLRSAAFQDLCVENEMTPASWPADA